MRTIGMAACGSALMLGLLIATGCDSARDEQASVMTEDERIAAAKGAGADAAIASEVERKLGSDQKTSSLEIDVRTSDGIVTLSGKVSNEAEKDRAEDLAEDVEGVKRVENNLVIARAPVDVSLDLASSR
jgi:osmotically-inducible protein OsmY